MTVLYKLALAKQVRKKDLPKVPKNIRIKVVDAIGTLRLNPRPEAAIRLTNREEYRLRLGVYRILYVIDDKNKIVEVRKVAHRSEVYKK